MAALDFPSSPSAGQLYTANGKMWRWDGTTWVSLLATSIGTVGYSVSLTKTANQSINDITETALTWDNEISDPKGMHSTLSNPSRITVQAAVGHLIRTGCRWDASGGGSYRQIGIKKNGATYLALTSIPMVGGGTNITDMESVAYDSAPSIGDYYEAIVSQDSGGALDVQFISSSYSITGFSAFTPGGSG